MTSVIQESGKNVTGMFIFQFHENSGQSEIQADNHHMILYYNSFCH